MLATLTRDTFSDPDWLFERKLDGERCLIFRKGKSVRLMSRNRKELNEAYPELEEALKHKAKIDLIADGEIVAFKGGRTSFARLQPRMQVRNRKEARQSGVKVWLYIFDLLYAGGADLTRLPLRERKKLLRKVFDFRDPIRFMPHRNKYGEPYHREACEKGWEGVIAKDAGAEYVHSRSRKWLKFKCSKGQELVIGGFTDPEGSRIGFGALLVGYYEDKKLVYAGKVGTGYDDDTLRHLGERLQKLERKSSPFERGDPPGHGVHWVTPRLVGEFHFTEWTRDNRLRHPSFMGLRRDKKAKDVVREAA